MVTLNRIDELLKQVVRRLYTDLNFSTILKRNIQQFVEYKPKSEGNQIQHAINQKIEQTNEVLQ